MSSRCWLSLWSLATFAFSLSRFCWRVPRHSRSIFRSVSRANLHTQRARRTSTPTFKHCVPQEPQYQLSHMAYQKNLKTSLHTWHTRRTSIPAFTHSILEELQNQPSYTAYQKNLNTNLHTLCTHTHSIPEELQNQPLHMAYQKNLKNQHVSRKKTEILHREQHTKDLTHQWLLVKLQWTFLKTSTKNYVNWSISSTTHYSQKMCKI